MVTAMPNSIGHQDLAALIARQPAVTERWRAHVRTSTFGTIHAASLSFPRVVGSAIPDPYFTQLAAVDPRALEATGSIPLNLPIDPEMAPPSYDFPTVDRRLKGDRLDVRSPETPPRLKAPAKSKEMANKDMDSRAPASELPPERSPLKQDLPVSEAGLPKGDRLAANPAATGEAQPAQVYRRFGMVAGQATLAKRVLGATPQKLLQQPASPPAPAPVAAVEAKVEIAAPAGVKPARRMGRAAAYLNKVRADAARLALAVRTMPPETAAATQRADITRPLVPAPAAINDAPSPEARQVADIAPVTKAEIAEFAPEQAIAVPDAPQRAVVAVPLAQPEKTADRFNAEAAEKLASFARPSAQTRVYFGTREMGIGRNNWEAWDAEETPTVLAPPHVDTEIKRAALDPVPNADDDKGGETIASKGEVTGEGKRPRTPAERLGLTGAVRSKHQKCLANAIYFEARGEVERGQMAVAQVILNRAFSGYYPGNVCDVVYQNAHRHLACQFTFACDNHRDVVRDPPRWEQADRIASDALDGRFWLPEIGKATHYHATYVNPWWVRTMTKHSRIGVHIFYRPTRWGTLDEIPVWGDRLEVTGSIKRDAASGAPEKKNDEKRAAAQPASTPARRSIFDPVEPIELPGG
jgi:spore germination cell wall hydrolase CwlJ-like protein